MNVWDYKWCRMMNNIFYKACPFTFVRTGACKQPVRSECVSSSLISLMYTNTLLNSGQRGSPLTWLQAGGNSKSASFLKMGQTEQRGLFRSKMSYPIREVGERLCHHSPSSGNKEDNQFCAREGWPQPVFNLTIFCRFQLQHLPPAPPAPNLPLSSCHWCRLISYTHGLPPLQPAVQQ